ncbi:MAG: uroporphyrinogen-III synthase [Burkholderiaceae bacterium]
MTLWLQALQAADFDVLTLPLIAIESQADSPAVWAEWSGLQRNSAVMFVSANAVRHWFAGSLAYSQKWLDAMQQPVYQGPRCWVPGPGTASALLQLGVPLHLIDQPRADAAQFDSEALWQVVRPQLALLQQRDVQTPASSRVLVVRGQTHGAVDNANNTNKPNETGQGRNWLAYQCKTMGMTVAHIAVYERVVPAYDGAVQRLLNQAAAAPHAIWLASSAQGWRNLEQLIALWGGGDVLHQQRVLATHPTIADSVRALGWNQVVACRSALHDVLRALVSMRG